MFHSVKSRFPLTLSTFMCLSHFYVYIFTLDLALALAVYRPIVSFVACKKAAGTSRFEE